MITATLTPTSAGCSALSSEKPSPERKRAHCSTRHLPNSGEHPPTYLSLVLAITALLSRLIQSLA